MYWLKTGGGVQPSEALRLMSRATLVVHSFSFPYVEKFTRCLHDILRRHLDSQAQLLIVDNIDGASHDDGMVFVIGENFPGFRRRAGCFYAYLNLSVITLLGSPFAASLNGCRQVWRKRRMLQSKLPDFDVVLDYYPQQTVVLQEKLSVPVLGFDVVVPAKDRVPLSDRVYDVCFVGGITKRRRRILDELGKLGLLLSEASGAPIEDFAALSRCCLNVHMERSNHLEIPRFLAAASAACPIVTEHSFGLGDFAVGDFVDRRPYSELVSGIEEMLSNGSRLAERAAAAHSWYVDDYLVAAERRWADLLDRLDYRMRRGRLAG